MSTRRALNQAAEVAQPVSYDIDESDGALGVVVLQLSCDGVGGGHHWSELRQGKVWSDRAPDASAP